jgi:hypothetical protein
MFPKIDCLIDIEIATEIKILQQYEEYAADISLVHF